jgi:hypothetical protein
MKANGTPIRLLGYLGWVTYIASRRGEIPEEVLSKYRVEWVPGFGSLIYLAGDEVPNEVTADHLRAAVEIYQTLERHGLYYKFPA